MASRSAPGASAAHKSRPGSEEAWADSRAVIFPHSRADNAASQGDAYTVTFLRIRPVERFIIIGSW